MIITVIIAFFSLIGLVVLHEFGHFILAKKFGVKVEEFGIGYPPKIFGKKIGETTYSLNWIPFGAFVKILGEEGGIEDYRSFSNKPLWQRFSIILGGVVSFWIVAVIILSIVVGAWGLPQSVTDEDSKNLSNIKVQITEVLPDSPAALAELKAGDVVVGFDKIADFQAFIKNNENKEIVLTIQRGQEVLTKELTPKLSALENQGLIGVALARVALKKAVWYQAPVQGLLATCRITANIFNGWILAIKNALGIVQLPASMKMEMFGPIGIVDLLRQYSALGVNYFLYLVAFISVAMALSNLLPIPALDGGKFVFLAIEGIRRKPIDCKIEQRITAIFFILLILLMAFITFRFDIPRLF
jgi:regulator of sigma E protease